MLNYVIIHDKNLKIIGIVENFTSCIWHSIYNDIGDFQIEAPATKEHLELLKNDNFVSRADGESNFIGIISNVEIRHTNEKGLFITASGLFCESLLNRRIICNFQPENSINRPTYLSGFVQDAMYELIERNVINCKWDKSRNIDEIVLAEKNPEIDAKIVTEDGEDGRRQVMHKYVYEYMKEFLEEYGYSCRLEFNYLSEKFEFKIVKSKNKTIDNVDGNEPIIFSKEYDNIISSNYNFNNTDEKNSYLIGGSGEGVDRLYVYSGGDMSGIDRKELWIDDKSHKQDVSLGVDDEEIHIVKGSIPPLRPETFAPSEFEVTFDNFIKIENFKNIEVGEDFSLGIDFFKTKNKKSIIPVPIIYNFKNKIDYTMLINNVLATEEMSDPYRGALEAKYVIFYALSKDATPIDISKLDLKLDFKYENDEYLKILNSDAKPFFEENKAIEDFSGEINVNFGNWKLKRDFDLGDLVTIQNNEIEKYYNARINEITEVMDENGYKIDAVYEKI